MVPTLNPDDLPDDLPDPQPQPQPHAMQAYGSSWLQQKLRSHFFPMVADRYGLDPN